MSTVVTQVATDYKVADLSLADWGRKEISIAEHEMPGLMAIRSKYAQDKPLAGVRVTGSLHMTIQTAVLIETLVDLGATVRWASCNIFSTQDHAAAAIAAAGVPVFAWKGEIARRVLVVHVPGAQPSRRQGSAARRRRRRRRHAAHPQRLRTRRTAATGSTRPPAATKRQVIKDLLKKVHAEDPQHWHEVVKDWRGVSRRDHHRRAPPLQDAGSRASCSSPPSTSTTRSPSRKFDNLYGCRESLADGIKRATDVMVAGKVAVVCGYGDVGKGSAHSLRGMGARVIVTEIDPINALQAAMEGFEVTTIEDTLGRGDIYVTCTGNCDIITLEHMQKMKDQAIVCNIGHFDNEIQVDRLNDARA